VSAWTESAVAAAAAAWVWVPPDADEVRTEAYQLARYPDRYFTHPACVLWSRTDGPVDELIDEVAGHVCGWGLSEVYWCVSASTRPAGTEAELMRRGATLDDTAQVLAYDMTDGLPELDEPPGISWSVVDDAAGLRAERLINAEVWGQGGEAGEPDEAEIESGLAEVREQLADWSGFRVVAYLDGEPAAYGGCTPVDGVARLWGAGTRTPLRGRGAYRVVLARRMALARAHGATLALVKGRVATSAPILRRAGFRSYGEERTYKIAVGEGSAQ